MYIFSTNNIRPGFMETIHQFGPVIGKSILRRLKHITHVAKEIQNKCCHSTNFCHGQKSSSSINTNFVNSFIATCTPQSVNKIYVMSSFKSVSPASRNIHENSLVIYWRMAKTKSYRILKLNLLYMAR